MRFNKRYILIILMIMTIVLQPAVYAQTNFKDIENHWAKKEIEEMVEKKFILGYPDGTFNPDKQVTKLDTLIMASRVLGVDKEENKEEVTAAEDTYKEALSSYNIYGKKEIAFLLSRKVLLDSELDTYLKGDNAKAYTKRYEAAIIFTKLMGKEKDVINKTIIILPFMDSQQIPLHAKPYVEFMTNEEIMKGITVNGKTEFKPNDYLTRAQIALMLLRVSKKIETQVVVKPVETETTFTGTISYLETGTRMMLVTNDSSTKTYNLLSSTPIKLDNATADSGSLEKGFGVTVKTKGNEILEVSATSRSYSKTVSGPLTSVPGTSSSKIKIKNGLETNAAVEEFELDEYVHITYNGNTSSIQGIDEGDYATIYVLSNGKVGKIVAEDKDKTVSGVVESVTVDDKVYLNVKVDGKTVKYEVLSDVVVYRNDTLSSLKNVKAGDEAKITLRYRAVKEIRAESESKTIEGTIEEILISKNPKITVKSGNTTTQYDMTIDAVIKVDNAISGIYDLRLGYKAVFELDNNIIIGVKAEKKIETQEVRGTIQMINLNLGVITLTVEDGSTQAQIYVNTSTTKVNDVINSKTMKLSDLVEGHEIIAYGKNDRGVFVTSLIVVTSEE